MELLEANLLSGPLFWVVLVALAAGLTYAVWFKSDRGALLFLWLLWFSAGLGLKDQLGLAHDLSPVVRNWVPWNFLLLALVPPIALRSAAATALLAFLSLQLVIPVFLDPSQWQAMPDLNEALFGWLPGILDEKSPLPLLMVAVALVYFVRWQITDEATELAGVFIVTLLMIGLLKPALDFPMVMVSGVILLGAVLYSSHRMAFVDALTGVRNRRALDAALATLGRRYAIAMLDIDHFKRINDRFGHDFGDQVLKSVATRLKRLRGFRLFRYGGEEFCLLFRGAAVEQADDLCEAAREAIDERPIAVRSRVRPPHKPVSKQRYREKVPGVKVTVSIGLARAGGKAGSEPEAVREAADKALYRSKKNGRNRLTVAK